MALIGPFDGSTFVTARDASLLMFDADSGRTTEAELAPPDHLIPVAKVGDALLVELLPDDRIVDTRRYVVVKPSVRPDIKASIRFDGDSVVWEGDDAVWADLPRAIVGPRGPGGRERVFIRGATPAKMLLFDVDAVPEFDDPEGVMFADVDPTSGWLILARERVGMEVVLVDAATLLLIRTIGLPPLDNVAPVFDLPARTLYLGSMGQLLELPLGGPATRRIFDFGRPGEHISDIAVDRVQGVCLVALGRTGRVADVDLETRSTHYRYFDESISEVGVLGDGRFVARAHMSYRFFVWPRLTAVS